MDIHKILKELREERNRLDQAVATLEKLAGTTVGTTPASGSTKHSAPALIAQPPATEKARVRKPMSPATKKRLSELAKQRWAKNKKIK